MRSVRLQKQHNWMWKASASVLIITLVAPLVPAQNPAAGGSLRQAVEAAKAREKEACKSDKELQKRIMVAQNKSLTARRKGQQEEAKAYWHQKEALEYLRQTIAKERGYARTIIVAGPSEDAERLLALNSAITTSHSLQNFDNGAIPREHEAASRFEAARRRAASREVVASIQEEIFAYKETRCALDRERTMLDQYMGALGGHTARWYEDHEKAKREAIALQHQRDIDRATNELGEFLMVFAISATALAILDDVRSATKEEKEEANKNLKDARDKAKADCEAKRGHFSDDPGGRSGRCSFR